MEVAYPNQWVKIFRTFQSLLSDIQNNINKAMNITKINNYKAYYKYVRRAFLYKQFPSWKNK